MDDVPLCMVNLNLATSRQANLSILIITVIILLMFSAFFSLAECAYIGANRIRLKNMENNGYLRAKKVLKQLDNLEKLINTTVLANNIVNIASASLAPLIFNSFISSTSLALVVSTVVMTLIIVIFCEIMPKSIGKESPERCALFVQPFISLIGIILFPLVWFFSLWRKIIKPKKSVTIKEDELITIIEEAESGGEIDSHESELIRSAIEFDDLELYDIMVPRVNVIAVDDDETVDSILETFNEHGFSRLPVYKDSVDSIIGILNEKDLFYHLRNGNSDFISILRPTVYLSRNMKISSALRVMQKSKAHMAVVVDEFGGTSGIVTMEDILEELVGEIYDEHDDEEELTKNEGENTFIVSGAENLEVMFEKLGVEVDDEFDSTSVGGFVTEQLKKIPLEGETFSYKNIDFTILKANDKKVIEVRAQINPSDLESSDE